VLRAMMAESRHRRRSSIVDKNGTHFGVQS
jgi:hypothetical protein